MEGVVRLGAVPSGAGSGVQVMNNDEDILGVV